MDLSFTVPQISSFKLNTYLCHLSSQNPIS